MDNQFANMSAFPQGMDFLKQLWAQGLAAQSAMPNVANMAGMTGASAAAAAETPYKSSAPSAAGGMTQAFQQSMASYLMPTFDVVELDKRIGDMRTVLQFMDMNTNMLRQSLQALEVQRNTVAALHSMMQPADIAKPTTKQTPPSATSASSTGASSTGVAKKKAATKAIKKGG